MFNGYGYTNGYGYRPAPIPQPQSYGYPQPQQVQMPQQQEQNRPSLQVPWVNGEVGAQAYILPPNSTVLLMDSDNPIFYIKTSDASGRANVQAFKYEELRRDSAPQVSATSYVTKEEFEEFKKSLLEKKEDKEEAKI